MSSGEDTRIGLRWIVSRPVESLLLVFGISLGIGATAAGIALAGRTGADAREILASTQYREIVVSIRESAEDMDLPATAQVSTENIILTTADLAAAEDAEDVQYAYVANRTGFRLGNFQMPQEVARTLQRLGNATFSAGDRDQAESLWRRAMERCRELDDSHGVAQASSSLALAAARRGELSEARDLLRGAPGVVLMDELAGQTPRGDDNERTYPTPLDVLTHRDEVLVGRIRSDTSNQGGLVLWCVADNLRKGAALNVVQISEELLRRRILTP